jgi:hypothetical protein
MENTPDYWHWLYYVTRKWEYPDDVDAAAPAARMAAGISFQIFMIVFPP